MAIKLGNDLFEKGFYKEAIIEYEKISKKSPLWKVAEFNIKYAKKKLSNSDYVKDPKVSIILPSLNVVDYIEECVNSAIGQTLREIEIICVDAGSTDGTYEKLLEIQRTDRRVKVIKSDIKSYGYQVNIGFAAAKGKYLAILETDDYVDQDMYSDLYEIAEENNLDLVKANFNRFFDENDGRRFAPAKIVQENKFFNRVLKPRDELGVFRGSVYTWAGIYNRDFIINNNIKHNESLGASYQDNGFWFQTFSLANRAFFVDKYYYNLRRDNPNSSFYSKSKVFAMCEEYDYIRNFLKSHVDIEKKMAELLALYRYKNYIFTLKRISPEYRADFLERFKNDFLKIKKNNEFNKDLFSKNDVSNIDLIINKTNQFLVDFNLKNESIALGAIPNKSDRVNVVLIADKNYLMPACVAITSIKENRNKSVDYAVFLIGVSLTAKDVAIVEGLSEFGFKVEVINKSVDDEKLKVKPERERVNHSALIKFDLPLIFEDLEKIIYIDSDVLVQKDLSPLFSISLGGNYAAVVKDLITIRRKDTHLKRISFKHENYFNSGVMLLNLVEMRKNEIPKKLIDYRINGINHFMDQDALNVVFDNRVIYVSPYFNLLNCFFEWEPKDLMEKLYGEKFDDKVENIYKKAVILHLGDKKKPWVYFMGYLSELYMGYYKKSPYGNDQIKLIHNH